MALKDYKNIMGLNVFPYRKKSRISDQHIICMRNSKGSAYSIWL